MSSKLVPSNPAEVMVIRKVTPNITIFSAPFWRFGRIKIGGRGTLVRMSSGALAVFSPTALTPEVKETVASMGEVKYIAALDFEHHMFVGPWHQEYPNAKVLGVEGLPEKREKQGNEKVPWSTIFTAQNKEKVRVDEEFDRDFDYEYVDGHGNKELVFCYKPDRTLIEGDLLFNLPATEQFSKMPSVDPNTGFLTRIFTYINHTRGEALAQRRFIWWALSAGNRPSYNKSVEKINGWNFDRIVPCHGDVIESGGKGIFQKIMQWHLEAAKKQS